MAKKLPDCNPAAGFESVVSSPHHTAAASRKSCQCRRQITVDALKGGMASRKKSKRIASSLSRSSGQGPYRFKKTRTVKLAVPAGYPFFISRKWRAPETRHSISSYPLRARCSWPHHLLWPRCRNCCKHYGKTLNTHRKKTASSPCPACLYSPSRLLAWVGYMLSCFNGSKQFKLSSNPGSYSGILGVIHSAIGHHFVWVNAFAQRSEQSRWLWTKTSRYVPRMRRACLGYLAVLFALAILMSLQGSTTNWADAERSHAIFAEALVCLPKSPFTSRKLQLLCL